MLLLRSLLAVSVALACALSSRAEATTGFTVSESHSGTNDPDFSASGTNDGSVTTTSGAHYDFQFLKNPSPTLIVHGTGGNSFSSRFNAEFDYSIFIRSSAFIPYAYTSCSVGPNDPSNSCSNTGSPRPPAAVGSVTGQTYLAGNGYYTTVQASSLNDLSPPVFCDGMYCNPVSGYTISVGGGSVGLTSNGNGGFDYLLDVPVSLQIAGSSFGSSSDWTLAAIDPVFTLSQDFLNALDPQANVTVGFGDLGNDANPNFARQVAAAGAGAVPEPATWAMMVSGFGLLGGVMRRRRTASFTVV